LLRQFITDFLQSTNKKAPVEPVPYSCHQAGEPAMSSCSLSQLLGLTTVYSLPDMIPVNGRAEKLHHSRRPVMYNGCTTELPRQLPTGEKYAKAICL
jgi:hypothetical protein